MILIRLCHKNCFVFVLVLLLLSANDLEARDIYVRLSQSGSYSVSTTSGTIAMTDGEGRLANLGDGAKITTAGNKASISGNSFLLPLRLSTPGYLKFNGRTYRGSFLITQKAGLLNVVDIEQYLYGVLPAEVGASWHTQALRAQAICARTYALKRSMSRSDRGYDVVDTDADQVYKGQGVETAKTNQAVQSTAGEIVTYGKEIADTYFHSDSGGHTANIKDVWGQAVPYLTGVPEVVNFKSPTATWNARISAAKIQSTVTKITGTDIGTIREIQVSEVDEGGRAVTMNFIGSRGSKTLRASQFRTAVDPRTLKSTMFTPSGGAFNVSNTTTPNGLVSRNAKSQQTASDGLTFEERQGIARMTAEGVFTTTELIDMLTNPAKQKNYYQTGVSRSGIKTNAKTNTQPQVKPKNKYGYTIEKSGNDFVFYGRGWGHGVGLCQWGAMAMAEQGWSAEKILEHYYPGTTIRRYK